MVIGSHFLRGKKNKSIKAINEEIPKRIENKTEEGPNLHRMKVSREERLWLYKLDSSGSNCKAVAIRKLELGNPPKHAINWTSSGQKCSNMKSGKQQKKYNSQILVKAIQLFFVKRDQQSSAFPIIYWVHNYTLKVSQRKQGKSWIQVKSSWN